MKAILLAAGRGERLRPLTDNVPKCLIPIKGRPLLDYWLEACQIAGFDDILINTSWLSRAVEEFIAQCRRPLRIALVHEPTLLGTAGTLRHNWPFVAGEELFLFAHADNYTNLSLAGFVGAFRTRARPRTVLAAALFDTPTPRSCGIVRLDAEDHIVEFHEKVASPPGNLANGAIYLGTPTLGDYLALDDPGVVEMDFSTEVIPRLMGRILGYRFEGFLEDIGTQESYARCRNGLGRGSGCGETGATRLTKDEQT